MIIIILFKNIISLCLLLSTIGKRNTNEYSIKNSKFIIISRYSKFTDIWAKVFLSIALLLDYYKVALLCLIILLFIEIFNVFILKREYQALNLCVFLVHTA